MKIIYGIEYSDYDDYRAGPFFDKEEDAKQYLLYVIKHEQQVLEDMATRYYDGKSAEEVGYVNLTEKYSSVEEFRVYSSLGEALVWQGYAEGYEE